MTRSAAERFWSKVDRSGDCWVWTAVRVHGYGRFTINGQARSVLAHRVAWKLSQGPIPEGLHVCHRCDNPPCCNPAHLFLGTDADNLRDCRNKGRSRPRRGEQHRDAKLTEQIVQEIRRRYAVERVTHRVLAAAYRVSHRSIGYLINRQTWAHVKDAG
jgi:hypothetical protein